MNLNMPFWSSLVAALYTSVGHGGASGYLALMSLTGTPHQTMAGTALVLNLCAAGTAWAMFTSAGHGARWLLWPFVAGSVPAAIIGGWMPVKASVYEWCLAAALLAAAVRLVIIRSGEQYRGAFAPPASWLSGIVGAGIGWLSGIVGVGGGIFLSPLMLLCRWADAKQTAAASAGFIVLNSLAGLGGRLAAGTLRVDASLPSLAVAVLLGGGIGSYTGAYRWPHTTLRRVLALVLVVAAAKAAMGAVHA